MAVTAASAKVLSFSRLDQFPHSGSFFLAFFAGITDESRRQPRHYCSMWS